mgnify:CR=1 FL=1
MISPESALPYIVNIAFPGVKSEVLLHHLEERNIYVSTGSACSSRKKMFSHVLEAMNVPPAEMDGAIRISFSCENDESDVEAIVEALSEIVPKLQNIRRGPR